MSIVMNRNGGGEFAPPPPPEIAQALQRATEEDRRRHAGKAAQLESGILRGFGQLHRLAEELETARSAVVEANTELARARQEVSDRPRTGGGPGSRELSLPLYVVAAVVFLFLERAVDQTALLALLIPTALADVMSVALPVVSLVSAHGAGVYLKRQATRPGASTPPAERQLGIANIAVGVIHAVAIGAIRSLAGGLLAGVLFGVVAGGLWVAMAYMAFRFHDDEIADRDRARRAAWWARRRESRLRAQAEKVFADLRAALKARVSVAQVRVTAFDAIMSDAADRYQRRSPAASYRVEVPGWVHDERGLAAGGELPAHLGPDDLQQWLTRNLPSGPR